MNASQKLIFKSDQINEARKYVELDLPVSHSFKKEKGIRDPSYEMGEGDEYAEGTPDFDYEEERRRLMEKVNAELEENRKERISEIEVEIEEQQKHLEDIKKENESIAFGIAQEAKEKAKKEVSLSP